MKHSEYRLKDGTIFFLDDGQSPEKYGDLIPHMFNGSVHLYYIQGRITQELASEAASKIVGVQAVASLRRFTLESDRIKCLEDAVEITEEMVYRLNRIITRGADASARQRKIKSSVRSTATVRRPLGRR